MSRVATLALVVVLAFTSACASGPVRVRKLAPETPAANIEAAKQRQVALQAILAEEARLAQAAKDAPAGGAVDTPVTPPVKPSDAPSMQTYDPYERFNRAVYRFNARFDEHIFLPVANGYRRLPRGVQSGVHNFFGNLSDISNTVNFGLQGRGRHSLRALGRFAINSTIGIGGLFDVARYVRLPKANTGFAETLSRWGMRPGPYLVLPILGAVEDPYVMHLARLSLMLADHTTRVGGITADNGGRLIAAGADLLAVIGGLAGTPEQAHAAARRYAALFDDSPRP